MDSQEAILFQIDPIWLNYAPKIRKIRQQLSSPLTREGEKITQELFNNPFFVVYNRLQPIFTGLVTLIEADEILKEDSNNSLQDHTTQRLILRAFSLLVEDQIKYRYDEAEAKKYEDYKSFFAKLLSEIRAFDQQIELGKYPKNFINSLVIRLAQKVNNDLAGVENFSINTEKIRERIQSYMPQLRQIDGGNIFQEIKSRWQEAFVLQGIK
jgi:hypothetical protein